MTWNKNMDDAPRDGTVIALEACDSLERKFMNNDLGVVEFTREMRAIRSGIEIKRDAVNQSAKALECSAILIKNFLFRDELKGIYGGAVPLSIIANVIESQINEAITAIQSIRVPQPPEVEG